MIAREPPGREQGVGWPPHAIKMWGAVASSVLLLLLEEEEGEEESTSTV